MSRQYGFFEQEAGRAASEAHAKSRLLKKLRESVKNGDHQAVTTTLSQHGSMLTSEDRQALQAHNKKVGLKKSHITNVHAALGGSHTPQPSYRR